MAVRGIRGANTARDNRSEEIISSTKELLLAILDANPLLESKDVASVLFTVTEDLQAEYPAKAARELGWKDVPLMCAREINVPAGLEKCIRVLVMWNTELEQSEINHVYLHGAKKLRPDLLEEEH